MATTAVTPAPTAAPSTPAPTAVPADTPAQTLRKLVVLIRAAQYLYDHVAFTTTRQEDFFTAVDALIPRPTPVPADPYPPEGSAK